MTPEASFWTSGTTGVEGPTADQDVEKNLTLIAYNTSEIPYTIQIEFVSLENLKSLEGDLIFKVARPGKTNLVTLQSIYINEKTSFNYRTQLFKGEYLPNADSEFPYLVPFEKGVTFSMPHTSTTDVMVDKCTREVRQMDVICRLIRERRFGGGQKALAQQ